MAAIGQPPAGYGLFGAYPAGGNTDPDITGGFESASMANRVLGMWSRYYQVTTAAPTARDQALSAGGRHLVMALTPSFAVPPASGGVTYAAITAGSYDTQMQNIAAGINNMALPVFVVWRPEMERPPLAGYGSAAQYIAAFQHVAGIMRAGAPGNVAMCWVCAAGNSTSAAYYPGDAWVDWVGVDPYDATLSHGTPLATYTPFTTWLAAQSFGQGKPLMIFETGVDEPPANTDAHIATWINAAPAALQSLGYQAWSWFNSSGGLGNTTIPPGTSSAAALATIGASAFFNPPPAVPPSVPYPVASAGSNAASATLVLTAGTLLTGAGGTGTSTGDAIVVGASINTTSALPTTVTDTKGNTYVRQSNTSAVTYGSAMFVALNATALVAGTDTITVTYGSAGANGKTAAAIGVPGALTSGASDIAVSATNAGSAAPNVTSGVLAQASEVIVAMEVSGSGGGAANWATGALTQVIQGFEAPPLNQWSSMGVLPVTATTSTVLSASITSAKWAMLAISLKVASSSLGVTTGSLPGVVAGASYSQSLTATGGVAPYTWAVSAGSLPSGLVLTPAGVVSGTAVGAPGTSSFTVQVTDSASNTATQALSIVVSPPAAAMTSQIDITLAMATTMAGAPAAQGGAGATPLAGWPQIIIEAGLVPAAPVVGAGTLILDDPVNGKLGTARLAAGTAWTDITAYALSMTITRPSSRQQGPLLAYQAGTASIVLDNSDGRFDPDNLTGPYVAAGVSQIRAMVPVRVRAIYSGVTYPLFSGFADGWLETPVTYEAGYSEVTLGATDALKVLAGITLATIGAAEGAGAATGARITDILTRAGWYTSAERRVIAAGDSVLQGTTLGDTALNLMQIAADSEIGQLYVNGAGAVVFRNRRALITSTRSATPQAYFGDNPGGTAYPWTYGSLYGPTAAELPLAAVGRADDDTTIANDIQATRVNGGVMQEVTDLASETLFLFPRTYARSDLILTSDSDALAWAGWLLYVAKSGENRFDSVSVDPLAQPADLWPQILGREMGDRIEVTKRPAGTAAVVKDGFISGITHAADFAAATWLTTWTMQDASKYSGFLTLDSGKLGTGVLVW